MLDHPGKWHRQTAIRLLGDRKDKASIAPLETELATATGQSALERLWALNAVGGLTDEAAIRLLAHEDPFVRAWTVRIVCDAGTTSSAVASAIAKTAAKEPYIDVRKQMACSARRLPPELALPIIRELLTYDEDAADIHQPLLVWWAIESQVGRADVATIVKQLLAEPATWQKPLVAQTVAERLMKRYALAGTRGDLLSGGSAERGSGQEQHRSSPERI